MPIFLALARGCTAFVAPRSLLRQLPKRQQQQQQQQQQQAHQDWRAVARRRGVRMMGGYASDEPTPAGSSDDSDASSPTSDGPILNRYSGKLTQPKKQGASQAMLYATGLKPEDLCKAQVGIGSVWFEGNPCNMHLLDLGKEVKKGVEGSGLVGYQFNTVGVSDGISMGTTGMRYSLQSRDKDDWDYKRRSRYGGNGWHDGWKHSGGKPRPRAAPATRAPRRARAARSTIRSAETSIRDTGRST